jgi:GTP-binding protein HflX
MAQLKYALPRLVGRNRAMSRLMGGIGGRGPGETKLEVDRRRARDRLTKLKKELANVRKQRGQTRERRHKAGLPIVSLVGYTNAGKSTLLNTLTNSEVLAENKLFATLDPTSRRIRFPKDREVVLTDTVGFIRRLPPDLKEAFQATLEELESANLLVLVADASHPEVEEQVEAVRTILNDMDMQDVPTVLVLNKWDSLTLDEREVITNIFPEGIPAVALKRRSLEPVVEAILAGLPRSRY